jgi:polyribonucleotide nucleotidyltransferase
MSILYPQPNSQNNEFTLITDILGWEDHHADMDFKVTGTRDGVTAIQLDNKVAGLTSQILKNALLESKKARIHILDEMKKVINEPNQAISENAPKVVRMLVPIDKIRDVIGSGGSIINGMQTEFSVEIDLNNDTGETFIYGRDMENVLAAKSKILGLIKNYEVGEIVSGKVFRIESFGAFINFEGKEGMIHISSLSKTRGTKAEDVVQIGQTLECQIGQINEKGQINLNFIRILE